MGDYDDIKKFGRQIMEANGWVRLWNMNSPRAVPPGAKGLSDQGWLHPARMLLLFVEEKYGTDKPTAEQEQFEYRIDKFAPLGVDWVYVSDEADWQRVAESWQYVKAGE